MHVFGKIRLTSAVFNPELQINDKSVALNI